MSLPPELENAAEDPVELTVAELLELFGERNRDPVIVGRIETELGQAGLRCVPTLLHGQLHSTVVVGPIGVEDEDAQAGAEEESIAPSALCVGDLPTARMPSGTLVSLNPDDDLAHARMVMLENHFSQLPVMSGPYVLIGVVSWQSIALAHARGKCESLADATEPAQEVSIKAELLVTIHDIIRHNCVFVRDSDQQITGLVTAADLSLEFGRLTGPFLQLGEIERRLRRCVERMCDTVEDLRKASGHGKANTADDLTFGQLQKVFARPDRWARLNWALHQDGFVEKVDAVRRIRNEVAHFRPNPLSPEQRQQMEIFSGLVKSLVP
ncbi:CBS domain-containing protein [Actinomadura rubrisoli]|uniref:CBS domain-containing protein n=1 Tax=Actinomadura rubrisoli TaxID=2530368 RepID=A0A4V2YTS1_9ACTN|nr:CBS domain-containing protein [Actinomadura rubrisoli]TDD74487.1 CBS domain-containing protein [Actinomadura rubrisoli]